MTGRKGGLAGGLSGKLWSPSWSRLTTSKLLFCGKTKKSLAHLPSLRHKDAVLIEHSHWICRFLVNCVIPSCTSKAPRWQFFFPFRRATGHVLDCNSRLPFLWRMDIYTFRQFTSIYRTTWRLCWPSVGKDAISSLAFLIEPTAFTMFFNCYDHQTKIFQRCKWRKRDLASSLPQFTVQLLIFSSRMNGFREKTWQIQFWTVTAMNGWVQVGFILWTLP